MAGTVQEDDDEPITHINIIPFVDIVLVILIIFMVTASYIVTPAIKVELPKAANSDEVVQSMLAFVITKEGDLFLNNAKASYEEVRTFIRAERTKGKQLEAIIAADAAVRHGTVVSLIDLIKSEGIIKFALNTEAEFSSGDVEHPPEEEPTPP